MHVDDDERFGPTERVIDTVGPFLRVLKRYHRHEVVGLQHVPREGAALLAVHHSLATYDAFLFGHTLMAETGRTITGLGDDKLFSFPGLRRLSDAIGLLPASPENGRLLLEKGYLLGVAPGGMREALRPSSERRTVRWARRKGFVRLAIEVGVPIVPVACPAADDLYTVYENALTKLAYKRLKVPVPIARGLGITALPRPVKLTTFVGEPIAVAQGDASDASHVDAVHRQVTEAIEGLLDRR